MAVPLVIDEVARQRIAEVKKFADENFIDESQMQSIIASGWAPGDIDGYSVNLQFGFRVVYTIEKHPGGWMRHLSMSLAIPDRGPSPYAVDMVLEEFGFRGRVTDNKSKMAVYMEQDSIVNVIEPLDENSP
jgi:hypothetical protein